jgi:hypothetical protein
MKAARSPTAAVFEMAGSMDPAIHYERSGLPALRRKQVTPQRFSRRVLFENMAAGRVSLFTGLNVVQARYANDPCGSLIAGLRTGFGRSVRARIQAGPSRQRLYVPVPTLMNRWEGGRARISVTDLHIRGTKLETIIDTVPLSDFNLLRLGSDDMAREEMMTMVVSSPGNVTDSHSDDPDGSNHCFRGSKLWLAWDTFEGLEHGLGDCERAPVEDSTAFDLKAFLSLRSSRWFVVSAGRTLFLPGHLTHRVITLEPYLGVGSFYVALPNCVRTIVRWTLRGPLWSLNDVRGEYVGLVNEIADVTVSRIRRLRQANASMQSRWGLPYLRPPAAQWKSMLGRDGRLRLAREKPVASLLREAGVQL